MAKPRPCGFCRHPVGNHSHMGWHECKIDRCSCPAYERVTELANVHTNGEPK